MGIEIPEFIKRNAAQVDAYECVSDLKRLVYIITTRAFAIEQRADNFVADMALILNNVAIRSFRERQA